MEGGQNVGFDDKVTARVDGLPIHIVSFNCNVCDQCKKIFTWKKHILQIHIYFSE